MTSEQFIVEIRSYCIRHANADNAIKYARYFKEDLYNGYGLTAPQIYAGAKDLLKKDLSVQIVMEAAPEILKSGKSDEITLMMVVLKDLHKQYTRETFDRINDWYKISVNNWAHADTLGMMILPAFLKRQITKIGDFKEWLHATNKFQRRSVPVTLIKTLKTNIQVEELFNLTDCLMTDPDREVHQGMGWFLREAWKRKPIETELFLMKWKELSPRLIIQYATEKMSKEERLRFRKNKAERKS